MNNCRAKKKRKKRSTANANFYTDSIKMAAVGIAHMAVLNDEETPDVAVMHENILNEAKNALEGSITGCVAMLTAQAMTLDFLYNKMIGCAARTETLNSMQISIDMALKIQNQCRKTLLGIGTLTNPQQATFIKQQNVALNQQVNNETSNGDSQIKIPNLKSKNELISEIKHASLDNGRAQKTSGINQTSTTLETVNRGSNG